jgi:hypothetical protein
MISVVGTDRKQPVDGIGLYIGERIRALKSAARGATDRDANK